MIQKEHILGGLIAIIVITGVQIATQMQMQRITQQVQMVQDNLSANVTGAVVETKEEKVFEEGNVKLDRIVENYIMGKISFKELTPFQQKLVSEIFEGKNIVSSDEEQQKSFKDWWCRNFYASNSFWSTEQRACTEGSQSVI